MPLLVRQQGGRSVLGIRPLLWKNEWPVAGENFKEGTERALAATAEEELIAVPQFTGAPEQLWRIDQLIDGTYRIMPKVVPNSKKKLALVSAGDSTPTLAEFDMGSDNSKWNFKDH